MKIRFQADNDLNEHIVRAVKRLNPEIDFQTAPTIGLHLSVPDERVLELAAQEGRILVTHDFRTMPDHFAQFIAEHLSPGVIIISRNLTVRQAAEWLHLIWEASEAEEYVNSILRIP
jgi:precorrin-6B methylase 1